jgi:hypothetical protein
MGDRRGWPSTLVEVADIIGDEAAMRLVLRFGGVKVYVPTRDPQPSHPLVGAIGMDASLALINAKAGSQIEVPTMALMRSKKAAIAASSTGTRATALEHGVTERYVRKVQAELEAVPPLLDFIMQTGGKGGGQ